MHHLQPDSSSLLSARSPRSVHRAAASSSQPTSPRLVHRTAVSASQPTSPTYGPTPSWHVTSTKYVINETQSSDRKENENPKATQTILRNKTGSTSRHLSEKRRVSCKDLGNGDCQGYLFKLKEGTFFRPTRWVKKWCVVKDYHLYLYDNQEAVTAQGIIDLRAFKISPASESDMKPKKFAFKVHHSGTTFIFAAERQEDMRKWMEKMGMSAIGYDMSHSTLAGFNNFPITEEAHYIESDEEENNTVHNSSATSDHSVNELKAQLQSDPMTAALSQIHGANIDLGGTDLSIKRSQTMSQTLRLKVKSGRSKRHIDLALRLGGLQRALKDRENELNTIEMLLAKDEFTLDDLLNFLHKDNPDPESPTLFKHSSSSSDTEL